MTLSDEQEFVRYLASETDLPACEAMFQECLWQHEYVELTETIRKEMAE